MPTRISTHPTFPAAHGGQVAPVLYRIVPQTPPLDPRETDTTEAAIEVVIVWGGLSVLHVAHLSPPRAFYVGERDADFLLSRDTLGLDRVPICAGGRRPRERRRACGCPRHSRTRR